MSRQADLIPEPTNQSNLKPNKSRPRICKPKDCTLINWNIMIWTQRWPKGAQGFWYIHFQHMYVNYYARSHWSEKENWKPHWVCLDALRIVLIRKRYCYFYFGCIWTYFSLPRIALDYNYFTNPTFCSSANNGVRKVLILYRLQHVHFVWIS